jgi:hypothetical protein
VLPAGEVEYILPSQFLLGNPRWSSSLAGARQRIHPAAAAAGGSGAGGNGNTHSRGVSLDWPGRKLWGQKSAELLRGQKSLDPPTLALPGANNSSPVPSTAGAAAGAAAAAGEKPFEGDSADGDALAAVGVRSKAAVGE